MTSAREREHVVVRVTTPVQLDNRNFFSPRSQYHLLCLVVGLFSLHFFSAKLQVFSRIKKFCSIFITASSLVCGTDQEEGESYEREKSQANNRWAYGKEKAASMSRDPRFFLDICVQF